MYQDNSIKMHFYVIGSAFNPRNELEWRKCNLGPSFGHSYTHGRDCKARLIGKRRIRNYNNFIPYTIDCFLIQFFLASMTRLGALGTN